jgi:predicted O-linked N-acetylglucosamine transferase (SPINDLY family)
MNNLGTLLKDRGHLDEALARYRQAMQADPGLAEPYFNSALILSTRGQLEEALCAYRDALARKPNHFKAAVNCGSLLERFGRFDEALECYRQIVAAQPELSVGHFRLGNLYRSMGKMPESIAAYQEAIRLQPDYVFAYNNLAVAYIDLGEVDAAENCARKGLQYAPQQGELHSNLATALLLQGRLEESLAARRTAVELLPDSAGELGNLVYDLNLLPDTDPQKLFDEHLTWAARHAEPLTLAAPPFANRPDPNRRIRIGYVSPYFRQHAVNYFMEPVLVSHDHEQFEVICYSDVQTPDTTTERLKAAVSGWRDVRSLSDEQLAGAVREDGIDILVDLSGHIGSNRLPTFARRAAPVQVTYIGYQNTTGMSAMDYRVTDAYADPPGQTDRYYTEKLVRLPRTFFVYRAPDDSPPVSRLPALASGRVTFGSFNKYSKVTAPTLEVWLQILKRLPDSRLLVLAQREGHAQKRLEALAASRGVDPARIELFGQQPHTDYMRLIAQADIALDPMPFNGHTTTCDALWMGVPVITLAGTSYASRFGSSAHHSLGLESFVADSPQQYVEIAARTAADLPALAALRAALRLRMQDSPLSDFAGFTRNLEDAYREMWRTWCAEKSSSQSTGC